MKHFLVDASIPIITFLVDLGIVFGVVSCVGCSGTEPSQTTSEQRGDMAKPFEITMHTFASPTLATPAVRANYTVDYTLELTGPTATQMQNVHLRASAPGVPTVDTSVIFTDLVPWMNYTIHLQVTAPPAYAGISITEPFITHNVFGPQPDLGTGDGR